MLETPQERVELLKAGVDGKTIEKLYIIYNNYKIIKTPILFEQADFDIKKNNNSVRNCGYNLIKKSSRVEIEPFTSNSIQLKIII